MLKMADFLTGLEPEELSDICEQSLMWDELDETQPTDKILILLKDNGESYNYKEEDGEDSWECCTA